MPGLTNGDTYTFTVTAFSAGGNSAPSAASPPVVVGAPTNPPQPPTIESLATGDGFVDVTFIPGAAGSSPTTGYLVTATDATDASRGGQTAQGTSSPIRVTGLTNADAYSFTVTALSAGGNSAPSLASSLINVGVPVRHQRRAADRHRRVAYSFRFAVSGAPIPTLTLDGTLPPGLTLTAAGLLSGTPTTAGSSPSASWRPTEWGSPASPRPSSSAPVSASSPRHRPPAVSDRLTTTSPSTTATPDPDPDPVLARNPGAREVARGRVCRQ